MGTLVIPGLVCLGKAGWGVVEVCTKVVHGWFGEEWYAAGTVSQALWFGMARQGDVSYAQVVHGAAEGCTRERLVMGPYAPAG